MIDAEEDGDRLTTSELYGTCVTLLIAGHETTTRLISNCIHLLLKHPDQLAKLTADPSLIPNAIEETLRYEPPVEGQERARSRLAAERSRLGVSQVEYLEDRIGLPALSRLCEMCVSVDLSEVDDYRRDVKQFGAN